MARFAYPFASPFGRAPGPAVVPVAPLAGESAVELDALVVLDMVATPGINLASVVISINGAVAFQNAAFQSGFQGQESQYEAISGGFRFTVDREADYDAGSQVVVVVTGADNAGNVEGP